MKHYGWIVFAIVGLVLATGLALMYSGGDLRTAGEAKRLRAQQLPAPPQSSTGPMITVSLTDTEGRPLKQPITYGSKFRVSWQTNANECYAYGHDIALASPFSPGVDSLGQIGSRGISPNGYLDFLANHYKLGYMSPIQIGIQCYDGQGISNTKEVQVGVAPQSTTSYSPGTLPVPPTTSYGQQVSPPSMYGQQFQNTEFKVDPNVGYVKIQHGAETYKIEVLAFSTSAYEGRGSVKFRVNGQKTDELSPGDSFTFVNGKNLSLSTSHHRGILS